MTTAHNANAISIRATAEQPDLFAAAGRPELRPDEKLTARRVPELIDFLDGRGWTSAEDCVRGLGIKTDGKRAIRDAAEGADGAVISGQMGYKLASLATPEEIREFGQRMLSQARKMIRRKLRTEKHWHAAGHTPV